MTSRAKTRLSRQLTWWLLVLVPLLVLESCKGRNPSGELFPPSGAPEWESRFAVAYGDTYTREPISLEGRAPNDVLDQRLFAARLGHADLVALVRVEQVWGRGRFQGRPEQFLDVTIGDMLIGELPGSASEEQLIMVRSDDDLPGSLQGEVMILFLRWAPGDDPPYHHHLMPADDEMVGRIRGMVKHAKKEGVMTLRGKERKGAKRRQARKERREARKAARSE
jgi:hypothetical protein